MPVRKTADDGKLFQHALHPSFKYLLTGACQVAERSGAQSVILGGAALVGMDAALQPGLAVPLIDNVEAGGRAMRAALARATATAAGPDGAHYTGLSAELRARLAPQPARG